MGVTQKSRFLKKQDFVESLPHSVNVNIKMYKSDKIKMYNYSKLI